MSIGEWNLCRQWGVVGIKNLPQLIVPLHVKIVKFHQLLLLGAKPALVEPFKSRLCCCLEEKKIAAKDGWGCDKETHRLHHVPWEFPERQSHECSCLYYEVTESTPQFSTNKGVRFLVNRRFLFLHFFVFFSSWVVSIWIGWWQRNYALDSFCYLYSAKWEEKNKKKKNNFWVTLTSFTGYYIYIYMVY